MPCSRCRPAGDRLVTSLLPPQLSLGALQLRVADETRAGAWLEGTLGLRAVGSGAWGTGARPLVRLREVPGARPVPPRGRPGLYHYAILLPSRVDLGRFLAHLERRGVDWAASDHNVSEALYLVDPDGITVEVYADRPRESWQRVNGELRLTLDPLDRAGLLAAGAGGDWDGIPEGAVVGHQHFFVGDLREAERHYVDVLGFEVVSRELRGALFVSAGGYHHHVGLNVWAAGRPSAGPDDAGVDEWQVHLGSGAALGALAGRLEAAGSDFHRVDDSLVVADPWGIVARFRA